MAKFKAKVNTTKATRKGQKGSKTKLANKIKKKAMKVKGTGKIKGDARSLIRDRKIGKIKKGGDARDILASLAKNSDARDKLVKNRLAKHGIADARTTKKGNITILTTTKGGMKLSTKHKGAVSGKKQPMETVSKVGKNVTKKVNHASGKISLSTKAKASTLAATNKPGGRETLASRSTASLQERAKTNSALRRRPNTGAVTKRRAPALTPAARLDEELMNTHVDPVVIKRTVRQNVRARSPLRSRSPIETFQFRERSRSPPVRSTYQPRYHYDDPRRELREEEMYRQRIREESRHSSHLTSEMRYSSPIQGVKLVVSNLEESVTDEDLSELFGDIGNVRKVSMKGRGVAEIVFVKREAAEKAVEMYDKRLLDGRAMKCTIEAGVQANTYQPSFKIPASMSNRREDYDDRGGDSRQRLPDVSSIHKALFSERRSAPGALPFASGSTQGDSSRNTNFTVSMPPQRKNTGGGRDGGGASRSRRY